MREVGLQAMSSVTAEDNGPPEDPDEDTLEDDDDLEAGWPMADGFKDAIMVAAIDSAYRGWCLLRGQEARML